MPKHSGKKTKGLTKKQMKLPKALRDAIMKKKKKQKGVQYAISHRWSFQRNEKDQEEKNEEKEKKIKQGWVSSHPMNVMGITTSTLIQELIPRSSGKRSKKKRTKSYKAKEKILRVKNTSS